MKIQLLDALKVSVLAIILSFGLSYALAWTAPTATPPAGNIFAPINTGSDLQTKTGNLSVANLGTNSITVTGNATVNDVYITSIGKWASELYPVNLVNGQHTAAQCSALGGSTVDVATGTKLCKLAGASCPVGWAKYNNWSTTSGVTLTYVNETASGNNLCPPRGSADPVPSNYCSTSNATCSTTGHSWSDTSVEPGKSCNGTQATVGWRRASDYDLTCPQNIYQCTGGTNVTATITITETGCY